MKLQAGTLVRIKRARHSHEASNPFNKGDIAWVVSVNSCDYTVGQHPTKLDAGESGKDFYFFRDRDLEQVADNELSKLARI
jgi:hypothetical protein